LCAFSRRNAELRTFSSLKFLYAQGNKIEEASAPIDIDLEKIEASIFLLLLRN
jgi:hypothetical protein